MPILLPVAGISVSLPLLAAAGALVGLLSGMFGVGGGFLLTPALMVAGVPATVAAASGSCQMVATSSSGLAAHFRMGN
ncbi:MAG: TSUP family transporter, partial [Rudaea sp.]